MITTVTLSMSKTMNSIYAKKRYFIFDLDGTLINLMPFENWDKIKEKLSNVALSEFGEKISFSSLLRGCDYVEKKYGTEKRLLMCKHLEDEENIAAETLATPYQPGISLLKQIRDYVRSSRADDGSLFIILSNNFTSTIEIALKRHNLSSMFDYVVGRDLAGKMKPDPAGLEHILEYILDRIELDDSDSERNDSEKGEPVISNSGKYGERDGVTDGTNTGIENGVKTGIKDGVTDGAKTGFKENIKESIKERMILFGDSEFDEHAARNFGIDFIYID